jgi:hypothetical protein
MIRTATRSRAVPYVVALAVAAVALSSSCAFPGPVLASASPSVEPAAEPPVTPKPGYLAFTSCGEGDEFTSEGEALVSWQMP